MDFIHEIVQEIQNENYSAIIPILKSLSDSGQPIPEQAFVVALFESNLVALQLLMRYGGVVPARLSSSVACLITRKSIHATDSLVALFVNRGVSPDDIAYQALLNENETAMNYAKQLGGRLDTLQLHSDFLLAVYSRDLDWVKWMARFVDLDAVRSHLAENTYEIFMDASVNVVEWLMEQGVSFAEPECFTDAMMLNRADILGALATRYSLSTEQLDFVLGEMTEGGEERMAPILIRRNIYSALNLTEHTFHEPFLEMADECLRQLRKKIGVLRQKSVPNELILEILEMDVYSRSDLKEALCEL